MRYIPLKCGWSVACFAQVTDHVDAAAGNVAADLPIAAHWLFAAGWVAAALAAFLVPVGD